MALASGKLRHRVEIQEFVEVINSFGEREKYWAHVADVCAEVAPLSAKAFIAAQQGQSEISARITIRYRPDLKPEMRIVFRGKFYKIKDLLPDPVSGLEYLTLPVSEGVGEG